VSTLDAAAGPPLALRARGVGAARVAAYVVTGIALGSLYPLALVAAVFVGAPAVARLAELERTLANRLLGARVPAPPPVSPGAPVDWRAAAALATKLPLTAAVGAVCAVPGVLAVALLVLAGESFAGSDRYLGPWHLGPVIGIVALALALAAAVLVVAALTSACPFFVQVSRRVLAPRTYESVAVREALAERLGDRTLAIAYWLPERELFVDERGRPVELPEPGSGRSWTAVEHDGRRVAAIIHDAELRARPELVEAAAAGAVLALENEQLKADLRARLEELRASRKRIVEASVEARRRLERDLHDGAQQQLVSLSIDLQLLRSRLDDESERAVVDATIEKLGAALAELRELARGIHPAVLSDRGLAPALEALAQRSAVPVDLDLALAERLPAGIETAAYFVAAEALTNVSKYARAGSVRVRAADDRGVLTVEIADDGVGGADAAKGTGLRGIADRVAALDGKLSVESPPGGGTRVVARIPYRDGAAR
jgi:signal transduction histidine kinase